MESYDAHVDAQAPADWNAQCNALISSRQLGALLALLRRPGVHLADPAPLTAADVEVRKCAPGARGSAAEDLVRRAAFAGLLEAVGFLARAGADVCAPRSFDGNACAHLAASAGHVPILALLAELTPPDAAGNASALSQKKPNGWTPAHFAAQSGHVGALRFIADRAGAGVLLSAEADGWLPVHLAAQNGALLELLPLLLPLLLLLLLLTRVRRARRLLARDLGDFARW